METPEAILILNLLVGSFKCPVVLKLHDNVLYCEKIVINFAKPSVVPENLGILCPSAVGNLVKIISLMIFSTPFSLFVLSEIPFIQL